MSSAYTNEKNTLIIIALLKAHCIRNIIASPGTTNTAFVGSIQNDSFFRVFSSADERSAAYIACGMAADIGEPVVISCTGATASRNYVPGLTEAYYRKLPVLAITSTQTTSKIGHHIAQVIDRSVIQNDIAKLSVTLPVVKDENDFWDCEIKVNKALLELKRHGGGPVHINLPTTYSLPFQTKELPSCRVIERITRDDQFPHLAGRIAVFIGSHKPWTYTETQVLDRFCAVNNAVVFCDHTSGYRGKYRLLFALPAAQEMLDNSVCRPDIMIHIGEISGDYATLSMVGKQVWRVNEDGEIRDTFRKLRYVFEMPEKNFFEHYSHGTAETDIYLQTCQSRLDNLRSKIPELPFSNIWVASRLASRIPEGSIIHFGILNSLRSWNFFELPATVTSAPNVGGFGIDGVLSSFVGSSLINKDKLYFCVLGDLAFFYDMNVLGNRHVGKNLRILLINNGTGTEFRQYNHHAAYFGEATNKFIAATGHYGNKSPVLVKHYAEDLGFEYLSASNKHEFDNIYDRFLTPRVTEKPIFFEVFTNSNEESLALNRIQNLELTTKMRVKALSKKLFGSNGIRVLKKVIKS